MRNWLRTLLFISAFSPVLLTVSYVKYDIYGLSSDVYQLITMGILGLLIPLGIIQLVQTQGESLIIQAKKIESNDFMLLVFIGSYMLPFILKASEMTVNAIFGILLILGLILWLINYVPAHPLLRMFKFKFYKLESSNGMVYILISKRNVKDPKEIKTVKKLSDSMLMESEPYV